MSFLSAGAFTVLPEAFAFMKFFWGLGTDLVGRFAI